MDPIILILVIGVLCALGVAWYLYMEHQSRILRTRVVELPGGGLRFVANDFSVEVQRSAKQLSVRSQAGQCVHTPLAGGQAQTLSAPFTEMLPAPGLQLVVERVFANEVGQQPNAASTGYCTITFTASDALAFAAQKLPGGQTTVLTIPRVVDPVAIAFNNFAARVRIWVEKMDKRMAQERVERLRAEAEAASATEQEQLLAEARANRAPEDVLTETDREALASAQIDKWRKTAGFTGTASEVNIDPEGRVAWFVDLADDGRITLHVDKRTIHTTLNGAAIASLGGELEIGVRDDYWTEEEPELRIFRLFKGLPPGERRAWKEKLELTRDSLGKGAGRK